MSEDNYPQPPPISFPDPWLARLEEIERKNDALDPAGGFTPDPALQQVFDRLQPRNEEGKPNSFMVQRARDAVAKERTPLTLTQPVTMSLGMGMGATNRLPAEAANTGGSQMQGGQWKNVTDCDGITFQVWARGIAT